MNDAIPNTGSVHSRDGTQLHYEMLPNPDAPAALLFVHGFGEHCGRYEHVLRWFHHRGYDVSAFDYRGHGRSEGERSFVRNFREYLADLDAIIRAVTRSDRPHRRVYLVGHSFGGLIASSYILEQPEGIDGAILSAPALGFKVRVNPVKAMAAKVLSKLWPTFALPTGIPPEHLASDESVGIAYMKDPLVNKVATARWYTEALAQQQTVLRHADRVELPILLLQGSDDQIVDSGVAQNFLAAIASADKEHKWYDGMYHEIFNDVRQEEVFEDIDTWLKKHL